MRRAFILVLLATTLSCGGRDPVLRHLQERLKSAVGAGKPDLTRDEVERALARQLRQAPLPADGGAEAANPAFPTRETLMEFYSSNGNRLVWSDDSGKLLPAAPLMMESLRRAGEHGLDPEDYAFRRLEFLQARIGKLPFDDDAVARLADFDLLMTAAFFRYAADLSSGRVHPDEIHHDWHTNPPELDLPAKLHETLGGQSAGSGGNLAALLEALPPPHAGYERLREALKGLREVEAAGGWPKIPEGPELKQGARGPRVALLRQRLSERAEPATPVAAALAGGVERFDAGLTELLRRFEERHGIKADGRLDATALVELNRPPSWWIGQVELNLERFRWIPRQLGDPHVLVNIPGFYLELVRGGTTVWRTRIVVGKAFTPTPVFSDQIVAIVVNPPWNVPESIALGEYLPEMRDDPKAFKAHGIRLLEGSGDDARDVDPAKVNWDKLDEGQFPYHLRQDPGPDNALGRVKFQLTNEFNIYLHDTPSRSLFGRSDRDLSHGCIRVEKPLELAGLILGEPSQELLREALDKTEERHLPVKPKVPIHILYLTAWVDEAGELRFGQDVYDLDTPQRAALDRVAARLSGGPASGSKETAR